MCTYVFIAFPFNSTSWPYCHPIICPMESFSLITFIFHYTPCRKQNEVIIVKGVRFPGVVHITIVNKKLVYVPDRKQDNF